MSRLPTVVPVVLAAGASTRMGSPKPLLPLGAGTYLSTILETLARAPVAAPIIVLGHGAADILEQLELDATGVLVNQDWEQGMLSSLQLGVRALADRSEAEAMLLVLVDVPRFRVATVRRLVEAFARTGSPLIVPAYAGSHGHPVVFGRALFPELLHAPLDVGARAVVDAHRAELLEVDVDDRWVTRDADTPAEHRRLIGKGANLSA